MALGFKEFIMKITLSPIAGNETTKILVLDDALVYNGELFDFSLITNGTQVDAELPAKGKIKRLNGEIQIKLQYNYQAEFAMQNQSKDVNDYIFTVENGACPCPIIWQPAPEPTCKFNAENECFEITAYSIYDHPETMGSLQHDDGQTFRTWSVSTDYENAINEWALVSGLSVKDAEIFLNSLLPKVEVKPEQQTEQVLELEVQENV